MPHPASRRPRPFRTNLAAACLALSGLLSPAPGPASTPPAALTIEELAREPQIGSFKLAPGGRYFGAIVTDEQERHSLLIYDLDRNTASAVKAHGELDISSFRWVSDEQLLYNVIRENRYAFGLFSIQRDGLRKQTQFNAYDATTLVGIPRARPNRALVWIRQSSRDGGRDQGLVEIRTDRASRSAGSAETSQVYAPPRDGTVLNWRAGPNGELAYCYVYRDRTTRLHRYDQDNRTWHPVKLDLLRYDVAGIDPDNRRLWISHYRPETGFVLQRLDPVTGALEDPVWLDPDYDLGNCRLYFSPRTGNLVGLAYHQKTLVSAWFDDLFRAAHATVSERYPERTVALVDFDEAEKRFVYHVASPDDPGRHVLLDLERRSVGTLSVTASWLDGRPLRPMQPVSFRTRDGLRLEGYLTLPAEASTEHRVPLVVLVHGGPWVRDTWQYDPLVQFLASRGYAVFQPNYRGSTGYTPAVSTESRFAFRRMHDDVTDATRSAARFEVIDGRRVAIIGGSFGGFLAAAGVAFEPDLYRCAATFAGVFDWEMLIRSKRSDGRPGEYERLIDELGRPGKDRDAFTAISPLAHADAIKVPMLVAHGREDRIVPVAQSKRLIASLRQRNIPHETYLLADATHGMAERKQRIEYYRRLESFLARYLRDAPPAPPP